MKSWCIPAASPKYVAKMEDVLDVYQRPYDSKRPVVCLDEKSKELHSSPHGEWPMRPKQPATEPGQPDTPGRTACQDYEYARNGTANLFLCVEPLRGWRKVRVTQRRTALDFAEQLRQLVEDDFAEAEQIVLVCDNLNTHSPACLYEAFAPEQAHRIARKLEWHYTPEHGSWLNMAECELSALQKQCLSRRLADAETLTREVNAWEQARNGQQARIHWQFTTEEARVKLRNLYPEQKTQSLT